MFTQKNFFWIALGIFSTFLIIFVIYLLFHPIGKPADIPIHSSTDRNQQDFAIQFLNGTTIEKKNFSEISSGNFSAIQRHIPSDYMRYLCNFSGNYSSVMDIALRDNRVRKSLVIGGILEGIYFYEPPCHAVSPTGTTSCGCSYTTVRIRGPATVNMVNKNRVKEYADYLVNEEKDRVEGIICHYTDSYSPDSTYFQFCINDCDNETCSEYPDVQHIDHIERLSTD